MKLLVCCCCMGMIFSNLAASEKSSSTVSVETEISVPLKATHAYVLLLISGDGVTISAAQNDCNTKVARISDAIRLQFKEAVFTEQTVNTGIRDTSSYRDKDRFDPNVLKVLTVSIPPDVNHAVTILDLGIKNGAIPFAADTDSCFGAVYFGADNYKTFDADLQDKAYKDLLKEAELLSRLAGRKIARMTSLYNYFPRNEMKLRYKDIKIEPPVKYYSSDINHISYTVILRATFELTE